METTEAPGEIVARPVEPPLPAIESEAVADQPVAGAAADSAAISDSAGADSTEPAPPALIEVWRPHRQHHHARRPEPRANKRSEPREGTQAAEADATTRPEHADRPARRPTGGERNRMERAATRPKFAPKASSRAPLRRRPISGEARPEGRTREARHGQAGRGQSRPRFDGQRDRREDGARNRSNDSERRHGRGGDQAPAEKKSFERPPDPNSPFAKLLALKASLEEKAKQDR